MTPQAAATIGRGGGHQLVLRPAEQRRDEQAGEREIVVGLENEADGGEQILHAKRRIEAEAIDTGHRHALGIKPRDEQRGEIAPPLDEDHHVFRPDRAALAFEHRAGVDPVAHLARDADGEPAGGVVDPPFLVLGIAARDHRRPQRHAAGPRHFAAMPFEIADRAEAGIAQCPDRGIDEFEDRPRRSERIRQR